MNVAYILNSTLPSGGATKSFLAMLKGLMNKGISPVIIIPDKEGIYTDLVSMQIPTYVVTFRMHTYPDAKSVADHLLWLPRLFARIIANKKATRKITRFLSDKKIDIIHSNVSLLTIGYQAAKRLHTPHVFHIREYVDKDFHMHYIPTHSHLERLLQSDSTYSICITKDIQRHHGLESSSRSRVIYNGIKPRTEQIPSVQKKEYLLFAGRIEPAKGVSELLESYAHYIRLVKEPLPLYLAGAATQSQFMAELNQFIEKYHISNLVTFLGDRKDIELLMQEATAIVIPSRFEAFGRCMAEAMFNGCLVIGKNTGGTKEQMENGINLEGKEIALRYETTEDLTQLLAEITSNIKDYRDYTLRAFHTVNQLYSSEANTQQVFDFYNYILHTESNVHK